MTRLQPLLSVNLKLALNFCVYLEKHRHRIVNYQYYQAKQICSIGSGAIESTVKQIDRRTKISGAQWKVENRHLQKLNMRSPEPCRDVALLRLYILFHSYL